MDEGEGLEDIMLGRAGDEKELNVLSDVVELEISVAEASSARAVDVEDTLSISALVFELMTLLVSSRPLEFDEGRVVAES